MLYMLYIIIYVYIYIYLYMFIYITMLVGYSLSNIGTKESPAIPIFQTIVFSNSSSIT